MTISAHLATSSIGSLATSIRHDHQIGEQTLTGTAAYAATIGHVVQNGAGSIGTVAEPHDPTGTFGLAGNQTGGEPGLPGSVPGFGSSDPDHRSDGTGPLSGLHTGGGIDSAPGNGQHDPDSTERDAGPSGLSGIGNNPSGHDLPGDFSASGPGLSDHMPGGPIGGFDNHGQVGHGPEGTTTHQSGSEYVPGAGMTQPVEHSDEGSPSAEAREVSDEAASGAIGEAIGNIVTAPEPQDHSGSDAGHDEGRPAPDDDHGGGNAGMPAPDDDSSPHGPAASSAMPAPDDDGSGTSSGLVLHNPAAFGAMPSPDDDGTGPHNPAAMGAIPAPDDNNPGGPAGLAAAVQTGEATATHPSHGFTFWDNAAHAIGLGPHDGGPSHLVAAPVRAAFEADDHGRTATGLSMTDLLHTSDAGFDHAGFASHADVVNAPDVTADHASWAASDLNPQPLPPEAHGHGFEALQIH